MHSFSCHRHCVGVGVLLGSFENYSISCTSVIDARKGKMHGRSRGVVEAGVDRRRIENAGFGVVVQTIPDHYSQTR